MTAPSLTLRSLQNEETGIDMSVPRFQEEEAPLGGVSILYEITVLTKLDLFKTRLHRNEDVVQFSVYKAYREIEDLYNKLNKKYPKAGLPPVPRSSTIDKYTSEEKLIALDRFMQAISKNIELCMCSTFTHFIGINSQRLPSFTTPNNNSSIDTNTTKPETQEKVSEDLSEVFPKVIHSKSGSGAVQSTLNTQHIDLFEEVKLVNETQAVSDVNKGLSSCGLFDDFEDDSLFSTKPKPKASLPPKQSEKVNEVKPKRKEPEMKADEFKSVDDSEIIIKDRKLGNISLFDEQDLGDYVTKEEEALFLVTPKTDDKSKKNTLLFSKVSDPVEEDSGLHENLDDLLNLNPLPSVSANTSRVTNLPSKGIKSVDETPASNINANEHLHRKPVPLPRKKSIGKSDVDGQNTLTKPEVMPRKVFLTKPELPSKPVLSATQEVTNTVKRPTSAKPVLPPKPKPPATAPKPTIRRDSKDLDLVNANKPPKDLENQNSVSSIAGDLNKLDILKYIEHEKKSLESEPSLFD